MTAFYADEHFPGPAVDRLRALGHDVLTARGDGRADQGIGDLFVLVRATALGRAVLTHNRRDFRRFHRRSAAHAGIVACTRNDDFDDLADRIHAAVMAVPALTGQFLKIYRPNPPTTP